MLSVKLLIFFMIYAAACIGQNKITTNTEPGNVVCIKGEENPALDAQYQHYFQNADNYAEVVSLDTSNPDTCVNVPFCNVRVNRTAFVPNGWGFDLVPSNTETISQIDFQCKMWFDGARLNFKLMGTWEEVRVTMWDINGKQTRFASGFEEVYTNAGLKQVRPILKYGQINHPRVVRFQVRNGDCLHNLSKLIYL